MSEDNIINIISHLQNNLKPIDEVDKINDIPGIYAIALNSNDFPFFNDTKLLTSDFSMLVLKFTLQIKCKYKSDLNFF